MKVNEGLQPAVEAIFRVALHRPRPATGQALRGPAGRDRDFARLEAHARCSFSSASPLHRQTLSRKQPAALAARAGKELEAFVVAFRKDSAAVCARSAFLGLLARATILASSFMRHLLPLFLLCVGVSACRPTPPLAVVPDGAGLPLVWMAQTYTGGQQCQPRISYSPPNVAQELASAGVTMGSIQVEELMVCQACTCPAYSARHYVQIASGDVEKAQALGFERSEPPPAQ